MNQTRELQYLLDYLHITCCGYHRIKSVLLKQRPPLGGREPRCAPRPPHRRHSPRAAKQGPKGRSRAHCHDRLGQHLRVANDLCGAG